MWATLPKESPDAIITSDIELRTYAPACRIDDFVEAMAAKLLFIGKLQARYGSPILDGGDIFDKRYRSHPSYDVVQFALDALPRRIVTIPGNHDLPGHSIDNYWSSAMAILEKAGRIQVATPHAPLVIDNLRVWGFPYRLPAKPPTVERDKRIYNVALIHTMVFKDERPFPNAEGTTAIILLEKFRDFDLLVVGHNHQSFVVERDGRLLVNPGSLMRADANQVNYKPRVFLWYASLRSVFPVPVPIKEGVISRDHIDTADEKNERLEAFVSKLTKETEGVSVSFEHNLEEVMAHEHVSDGVREKVKQYRLARE